MILRLDNDRTPVGPNARIDNGNVDRSGWEISMGRKKSECRRADIVRRNIMRDIHQNSLRESAENHPFHRTDKIIIGAKISEKSNNSRAHLLENAATCVRRRHPPVEADPINWTSGQDKREITGEQRIVAAR